MECWNNGMLGFFPIFHFSVFPYDYVIWGEMNPAPLIRGKLTRIELARDQFAIFSIGYPTNFCVDKGIN